MTERRETRPPAKALLVTACGCSRIISMERWWNDKKLPDAIRIPIAPPPIVASPAEVLDDRGRRAADGRDARAFRRRPLDLVWGEQGGTYGELAWQYARELLKAGCRLPVYVEDHR